MQYKDLTYNISWTFFFFFAYSCIKILSLDIDSFRYFSTFALNQQHPSLLLGNNASVEHHIFPCRRRCVTQRCLCQGFPHACAKISALKRLRFILGILGIAPPLGRSSHCDVYVSVALSVQGGGSWTPPIMTQSPRVYMMSMYNGFRAFFSPPGNIRCAAPGGSGEHKSNVCER